MTVHELFKNKLKEKHITQMELAVKAGVTLGTVNGILTKRHATRFDTMCIVADALELSLDDIAQAYKDEGRI